MKDLRFAKPNLISAFCFLLLFNINFFGQTLSAEKNGTVIAKNNGDEFNRQRIVQPVKPEPVDFRFSDAQIYAFEKEVFQLINQKRKESGLNELVWSDEVAKVARFHSADMADNDFFGHRGQDGKMVDERADLLGLRRWRAIGENIAFNYGYKKPLEIAVEKWMLSAGHRQNLLNPRWKETGIGICVTAEGKYYFTQVFLERK